MESSLELSEKSSDVIHKDSEHTDAYWICNPRKDVSFNLDGTWNIFVKDNTEEYLTDPQGTSRIPKEENKLDSPMYCKYRIGGSVESIFSQTSVQNGEWTMLRPSRSQDALSLISHPEWLENKPDQPKSPDIVDDVVGDEIVVKYPGHVFQKQNITDFRQIHLTAPTSTSFISLSDPSTSRVSRCTTESVSRHKEDCESNIVPSVQYDPYQGPSLSSSFNVMKNKEMTTLELGSEQSKKMDSSEDSSQLQAGMNSSLQSAGAICTKPFVGNPFTMNRAFSSKHTIEKAESGSNRGTESNRSQDISVSLLNAILKEREVKINDLSKDLLKVQAENIHLQQEKDNILSETESLRRQFEVISSHKERSKLEVLNSFDPCSPVVLQQKIVNLKDQIDDLQEANESAVLELAKADEEISQHQKDMAKLKAEYMQKLEDSQEQIKMLTEKISRMPDRLTHSGSYEEDLHREISQLRSECRRLRAQTHQLNEQNHRLQEELWDVKRENECILKRTAYTMSHDNYRDSPTFNRDPCYESFQSSSWNTKENSRYRNDAFKVDGTFSKCKAALGPVNIKGLWEKKHDERFKDNPSPLSVDSENTDILITGYHEDNAQKPSHMVNSGGSLEDIQELYDDDYSVQSKEDVLWNSIYQTPKSTPSKAFSRKPPGTTRLCTSALPRRPFAPQNVADLKIGHLVKFSRPAGKISKGIIQYKGHLRGREELYLGVELEGNEVGKHDGTFQGARYFLCKPNKGVFVNFNKIIMAWE
ncbi:uncharacterized protein RCH25_042738 [Pelodytes ibericus]